MSDDERDEAESEVRSRVRRMQRRGEVAGSSWLDVPPDVRRKLKRRAGDYVEDGEDPDEAARHAIKRSLRDGTLKKKP